MVKIVMVCNVLALFRYTQHWSMCCLYRRRREYPANRKQSCRAVVVYVMRRRRRMVYIYIPVSLLLH